MVLISDGQDTSEGESPLEVVTGLPGARELHVYGVLLGNPDSDKNLRVDPVRAKDVVLVRDQVLFEADLRHKGLAGATGVVARLEVEQIADADGRPLAPRRVELPTPIDVDGIAANLKNGMLAITAPKAEAGEKEAPRKVKLSTPS